MFMSSSLEQAISDSVRQYLATPEGEECERLLIQQALYYNQNNQSHAALWLGITRNTLKKKMLEYGLYEAPLQSLPSKKRGR